MVKKKGYFLVLIHEYVSRGCFPRLFTIIFSAADYFQTVRLN